MPGFILRKTLLKATSTFTELGEEQAAPRTKTGRVTYVTGERLAFCATVAGLKS